MEPPGSVRGFKTITDVPSGCGSARVIGEDMAAKDSAAKDVTVESVVLMLMLVIGATGAI